MPDRWMKDPSAVLEYINDWSDWLNGDTIVTSTWTAPTGITKTSEANSTTTATVLLSGGTAGTSYVVVNRIVTAAGRTDERSLTFYVTNR